MAELLPHGDSITPWFYGGFAPWRRACSIVTHLRLLLWATRTNLGRKLAWGHAGSYCILNTSVALEIKMSLSSLYIGRLAFPSITVPTISHRQTEKTLERLHSF